MRNGKLSYTELRTLAKASDILDAYITWEEEHEDYITLNECEADGGNWNYQMACEAAGGLGNFGPLLEYYKQMWNRS